MQVRDVARGVLLRPDGAVLLYMLDDGALALPGGGVEESETHEQALARELWEEIGLQRARVGPMVWTREHVYKRDGRPTVFRERHFLVEVGSDCPSGPGSFVHVGDGAAHRFEPPELPRLLAQLRRDR